MKIGPIGVELFHANGRTDIDEAFRNFANPPKNDTIALILYFLICKLLVLANRVTVQSRAHIPLCNIWNCPCGDYSLSYSWMAFLIS
jgi:hypothetical protein